MLFVTILLIIISAVLDNSVASLIIGGGMFILGEVVILIFQRNNYKQSFKLYHIVYAIYIIFAFIVSNSFSINDYFLVSDPSRYLDFFLNSTDVFWNKEDIVRCYLEFTDSNALHNAYLNNIAVYANKSLGGITVYSLTLCHTIWGVLSSVVLFRILSRRFDAKKAFHLSLVFAVCSLFMFYSTVIIRDIIICFFYLVAFDIVDQKFTLVGVAKFLLIILIVWGIRLYSGLFLVVFLCYYFYKRLYNSAFRPIATFVFAIVLIITSGSILASDIVTQTMTEMQEYTELAAERSEGGMVSKLQSLPPGISHLAIVFFMMIRPLPPFSVYIGVETLSHFLMSTMLLVAGFFWFVLFYSLCYQLFVKKHIFKIPFDKIVLLVVCLVFMLANASHPDIRRMLPVFPILYLQYAEICKAKKETLFGSGISRTLMVLYILMAFGMLLII